MNNSVHSKALGRSEEVVNVVGAEITGIRGGCSSALFWPFGSDRKSMRCVAMLLPWLLSDHQASKVPWVGGVVSLPMIPWDSIVQSFCFLFLDPGPFRLQRDALFHSLRLQPRLWYVAPWWAQGVLYFTWSRLGFFWHTFGWIWRYGQARCHPGTSLYWSPSCIVFTEGTVHWDTG